MCTVIRQRAKTSTADVRHVGLPMAAHTNQLTMAAGWLSDGGEVVLHPTTAILAVHMGGFDRGCVRDTLQHLSWSRETYYSSNSSHQHLFCAHLKLMWCGRSGKSNALLGTRSTHGRHLSSRARPNHKIMSSGRTVNKNTFFSPMRPTPPPTTKCICATLLPTLHRISKFTDGAIQKSSDSTYRRQGLCARRIL